jgi:hypothetical protein
LTQPDSEGAAPIHWLCTLGGSMRHEATSTLALPHERPRSFAHGAPPVRAIIPAPAAAAPNTAPGRGSSGGDTESRGGGESAGASSGVGVALRGCSAAVVAKVRLFGFGKRFLLAAPPGAR